jgi:hypothetical protein
VGRIVNRKENGPVPLGETKAGLSNAFLEWDASHLRYCIFLAVRDDKKPSEVVRQT